MKVLAFILSLLTAADMCVGQRLRTVEDTFQIMVSGDCDKKDMCLSHEYGEMKMQPCTPIDGGNTYRMADNGALISSGRKDNKFKYYQATASKGKLKMKPATEKNEHIRRVKYDKKKVWMFNPIHDTLIYAGNHKKDDDTKLFYPAATVVDSCENPSVKLSEYMQKDKVQLNKFEIVYLKACPANPDGVFEYKGGKPKPCKSLDRKSVIKRKKFCDASKDAKEICKLECKECF